MEGSTNMISAQYSKGQGHLKSWRADEIHHTTTSADQIHSRLKVYYILCIPMMIDQCSYHITRVIQLAHLVICEVSYILVNSMYVISLQDSKPQFRNHEVYNQY